MALTRFTAQSALQLIGLALILLMAGCGSAERDGGEGGPPPEHRRALAVAAGSDFSLALVEDGSVYAWGANGSGQLGSGDLSGSSTPGRVTGLASVVQIAAGLRHSLALVSDGTVWAWGHNNRGQIGVGWPGPAVETQLYMEAVNVGLENIVAVAARGEASYALDSSGTVWSWGNNSDHELGDGTSQSRGEPAAIGFGEDVVLVEIFAGTKHAKAVDEEGNVWVWGSDAFLLGNGVADDVPVPAAVADPSAFEGAGFALHAVSSSHALAVSADGELLGWGANSDGELGMADSTLIVATPTPIPDAPSSVTHVAAGGSVSIAVSEGEVYTWGTSYFGELGNGTTDGSRQTRPTKVDGLADVIDVAAAPLRNPGFGRHVLVLTSDGLVHAWGANGSGQLGTGDEVDALRPVRVGL